MLNGGSHSPMFQVPVHMFRDWKGAEKKEKYEGVAFVAFQIV